MYNNLFNQMFETISAVFTLNQNTRLKTLGLIATRRFRFFEIVDKTEENGVKIVS